MQFKECGKVAKMNIFGFEILPKTKKRMSKKDVLWRVPVSRISREAASKVLRDPKSTKAYKVKHGMSLTQRPK